MAHKVKRKSSQTRFSDKSSNKQPSNVKYTYTKPKAGVKGSAAKPQVSSVSSTPETSDETASTTTTSESSSKSYDTPALPSVGGNAQIVLILGSGLFAIAQWNTVVKPLASTVWNGKSSSVDWKSTLGMLTLLGAMVFIASVSEDAAGLMLVIVIGMWMVYLIESGTGTLSTLFNWFGSGTSKPKPAVKK